MSGNIVENRRRRNLIINILFALVAILLITIIAVASIHTALKKERQVQTDLVFSYLFSTVEKEFDMPIHAAMTMASDVFLRDYVKQEEEIPKEEFSKRMGEYLSGVCKGNGWGQAYFSSAPTMNYYTINGFGKVIDPSKDEYDLWYTEFVESGKDYDLDVEFDQMNNDVWTVFIDKRMEDTDGSLLGVCTLGLEISSIQQLIGELEKETGIKIYFTDEEGKVQVGSGDAADTSFVLDVNLLVDRDYRHAYESKYGYVISQYIPLLDWHLVVCNDQSMNKQVVSKLIYMAVGMALFIISCMLLFFIVSSTRARSRLHNEAETDELTQVLNRLGTEKRIRSWMATKKAQERGAALFIIDVDNFKTVNDTFGHSEGDTALVQTARRLRTIFRDEDVIGRFGGDEFVVFCPGVCSEEAIKEKGKLLNLSGQQDIIRSEGSVHLTLSVGVAIYPEHANTYEMLFRQADRALYEAKEAGKDRFVIYRS